MNTRSNSESMQFMNDLFIVFVRNVCGPRHHQASQPTLDPVVVRISMTSDYQNDHRSVDIK